MPVAIQPALPTSPITARTAESQNAIFRALLLETRGATGLDCGDGLLRHRGWRSKQLGRRCGFLVVVGMTVVVAVVLTVVILAVVLAVVGAVVLAGNFVRRRCGSFLLVRPPIILT